jgi:hypothetical protein
MVAFMEESGVKTRDGHIHRRERPQFQFRIIAIRQAPFVALQLFKSQITNYLFKQHCLVSDYYLYPPGAITNNFISKGGDEPVH